MVFCAALMRQYSVLELFFFRFLVTPHPILPRGDGSLFFIT
jgi:hypothetical protein